MPPRISANQRALSSWRAPLTFFIVLALLEALVFGVAAASPPQFRTTVIMLSVAIAGGSAALASWLALRRTYFTTIDIEGTRTPQTITSSRTEAQEGTAERVVRKLFGNADVADVLKGRKELALVLTAGVATYPLLLVPFGQSLYVVGFVGTLFLFFSGYMWWFFATIVYVESKSQYKRNYCNGLEGLVKLVRLELPSRCHYGDSHNIKITAVPGSKNKSNYLEIELQAAGMSIRGDYKQRQSLNSLTLSYRWNANFSKAGTHVVNVLFREVDASGGVVRLAAAKECLIRVLTLDRQYGPSLIIAIATIITLGYTMRSDITTVLHGFGV